MEGISEQTGDQYAQAIAGEGEYWDNFIAQRLLRGEMPGSVDWRLAFAQFRYNHGWRPLCLGPQGVNFRMREINHVLTTAVRRPRARVLDLGCGAGWLSLELARQGAHVTALDISPTNLALARYMAETNALNFPFLYQSFAGLPCRLEEFGSVEYAYSDLNKVDLPKGEYDAVVVWDSLHHVAEIERLLEQVRGALKPDGVFVGMDHAFATPRTHAFNQVVMPWVEEFYAWVTANDPEWFYDDMNAAIGRHEWGILQVDYDPTPIEGFQPFADRLFAEMLDIIGKSLRQEALDRARAGAGSPGREEEESPFEDVSVERLMRVLLESFRAERFNTVCPFIQPELHIPHYRNEKERIFQHQMASVLVNAGERAIAREEADGQWFLFQMTPERPMQLSAISTVSTHEDVRDEPAPPNTSLAIYLSHLETELKRKNTAITDLEERLRRREAELVAARAPKLPWKRRKPT